MRPITGAAVALAGAAALLSGCGGGDPETSRDVTVVGRARCAARRTP
ncbi:hypothetical protein [Nocardia wallacei]|nr:hypothetical protein [Nocardia wallacei]